MNKIESIQNNLDKYFLYTPCIPTEVSFARFYTVEEEFDGKLITNCKSASCLLDPVPTKVLNTNLDVILPVLTKMVNNLLNPEWKTAVVTPLLKKKTGTGFSNV